VKKGFGQLNLCPFERLIGLRIGQSEDKSGQRHFDCAEQLGRAQQWVEFRIEVATSLRLDEHAFAHADDVHQLRAVARLFECRTPRDLEDDHFDRLRVPPIGLEGDLRDSPDLLFEG
jgi:hypothetical protein